MFKLRQIHRRKVTKFMLSANNSVAEGSKHDFSIGITKPTQDEVVVYFDKASPSQIKAMTATWKLGTNFNLCFSGRVLFLT